MRLLTVGKMRGLQQCSTDTGAFSVLALADPISSEFYRSYGQT